MTRFLSLGITAVFIAAAAPTAGSAQATIYVSGGAGLPISDYGEYATTGWMAQAGVAFAVGAPGVYVGAGGFYGMNNHAPPPDGDKTNLYGAAAFVQYTIGEDASMTPYVFAGAGFMTHSYRSETSTEGSSSGLAGEAGAGLNIPLGGVTGYLEGMYLTGFGDIDGTDAFVVSAGVSFTVGAAAP